MKALFRKYPLIPIILASVLLSAIIILLSCSLASFIYPVISMQPYYNDPSTFVVMGRELVAGKTPYLEVFDHKGLYIFYITFLYAYLGKFWIFLFMVICMTMSFVFLVLTLKELELSNRTIVFGLLFFAALYTFFAQFPGDADLIVMVGMLMMYFYVKGCKNNNNTYYLIACLLAGASAGIALNIRPSDAMLGFAFIIFYIVKRIREKKYGIMVRDAILCLVALGLVALPAYIHAYAGHFLKEMVDAVFLSNFRYLGSASDKSVTLVWMSRAIVLAILTTLFLLWFFKRKEYEMEQTLFLLIMSGIIFTIQFVIALFAHYLISVSGFIAVALCITMSKYHLLDESNSARKPLTGAVFALFGLSLLLTPTLYLSHLRFDLNDIAYIKETISEEDRKNHTFLFSVAPGLYLNTGINVIYPDFNAQTYHLKLSKKYTVEHMASFVQSEDCHYLVMKKDEVVYFRALIGTEMYLKESVTKWTPTTIIIYRHVIL